MTLCCWAILWNAGNHSPSDIVTYHIKPESSATLLWEPRVAQLWEPQILQSCTYCSLYGALWSKCTVSALLLWFLYPRAVMTFCCFARESCRVVDLLYNNIILRQINGRQSYNMWFCISYRKILFLICWDVSIVLFLNYAAMLFDCTRS